MTGTTSRKVTRWDTTARSATPPFLRFNFAMQSNLPSAHETRIGPHLVSAGRGAVVAHEAVEGRALFLVLQGEGTTLIELRGLLPERHYRTGHAEQPFLRADRDGRALLRLALCGSVTLAIEPVV